MTLFLTYKKKRRKKELDDEEELDDMPRLEGDEKEVKEGKGLKILTPNNY